MDKIASLLKTFYEWSKWEGLMHSALLILSIYILILFYQYKKTRTISNLLLLSIVLGIDILIHQNINIRNNANTHYL